VSLRVDLDRLLQVAADVGTAPMLLTTDDNGRPRAAAVSLSGEGEVATVRAGRRSLHNCSVRPLVSLLWPAPPGERFALLVDGEVAGVRPDPGDDPKAGGVVTVRATGAILHVVKER
jgi:hypothetical protein